MANFPNHKKIEHRTDEGEEHHRYAKGVLMKAFCGRVNSRGCRNCAEADRDAHSANGNDRGAGALQNGKENSRPPQQLEPRGQRILGCGRLLAIASRW